MNKPKLYPLKFKPILKKKIWGGKSLLYKDDSIPENSNIGESWEISSVKGSISIVSDGHLKHQNLNTLITYYKEDLVGKSVYNRFGDEFPLLIKFIDAKDNLSVQLHPDDKIAKAKHNSMGKTEMWYVLSAEKDSFIISDFNKNMNKEFYLKSIKQNTIQQHLKQVKVSTGDVFFITPGLIHAIGSGVFLAEIQQTSDITYRIYDWGRLDAQGKSRDLHQKEALDAIDFTPKQPKIDYTKHQNNINKVVHNIHFKTDYLKVKNQFDLDLTSRDSFTILINVGEDAKLKNNHEVYSFKTQETYLIPACISNVSIEAENAEILMVHI